MLVRKVCSSCSSLMSSSVSACSWNAALLTRMSSLPQRLHGGLDGLAAERGVGHVAGDEQRPAALRLDRHAGLLRILVFAQVDDRDIRPLAGEQHRHRAPDARVAAGDERHLALELGRADIVRCQVGGTRLEVGLAPRLLLVLFGQRWRGVRSGAGLDRPSLLRSGFGGALALGLPLELPVGLGVPLPRRRTRCLLGAGPAPGAFFHGHDRLLGDDG